MSADAPHLVPCSAAGATARPTSRKLADASCTSSYGQCGGTSCQASGCPSSSDSAWTCCPSGFTCQRQSQYYWQCLTGNSSVLPSSPVPSPSAHSPPSALSPPAQSSSSPPASAGTSSPQGNAAAQKHSSFSKSDLSSHVYTLSNEYLCSYFV